MDWIEKIFGLRPDGGDGSLEIALSLAIVAMIVIVALAWRTLNRKRFRRD
jgi:hypothetical protein